MSININANRSPLAFLNAQSVNAPSNMLSGTTHSYGLGGGESLGGGEGAGGSEGFSGSEGSCGSEGFGFSGLSNGFGGGSNIQNILMELMQLLTQGTSQSGSQRLMGRSNGFFGGEGQFGSQGYMA